jgi:hypothetical protein
LARSNGLATCSNGISVVLKRLWLADMLTAWQAEDTDQLRSLDAEFIASREAAELHVERVQMGYSLLRLLKDLPDFPEAPRKFLRVMEQPSFPMVWSAAAAWQVPIEEGSPLILGPGPRTR